MADSSTLPASPERSEITDTDWRQIAFFVSDTLGTRAARRNIHEKKWREIDRQVAMEPESRFTFDGKPVAMDNWMSELELPWQAQTLETLNSDARRLIFPDDRRFFKPNAALEDKVLKALEEDDLIFGFDDESRTILDVSATDKGTIDQTMMNEIVYGAMSYIHGLYDMRSQWDLILSEAFKYGCGIGKARRVNFDNFTNDYRGVFSETKRFPVIAASTIWNTYLDTDVDQIMHEGLLLGPSWIETYEVKLDDLKMAGREGSNDPTRENGGWIDGVLEPLDAASKHSRNVRIIEYEGDLLIPRNSGRSLFLPNVIVNVVISRRGPKVYRYREREYDFRSYIKTVYHQPDIRDPYGDSPLMMGSTPHKTSTDALNMMMDVAALHSNPPTRYNPGDQYLAATGGPLVAPGKNIEAIDNFDVMEIGRPEAMALVFQTVKTGYNEVTGTTAPRLGQQTKSHQTKFAVNTEQTRGMVRTVDFVQTFLWGPMTTFLNMEYAMLGDSLTNRGQVMYMDGLRTWLKIRKRHLPEHVFFDAHGVAGPIEQREAEVKRQQAIALFMQLEGARRQDGGAPADIELFQRQILEDAEYDNIDELFAAVEQQRAAETGGGQGGPGAPGPAGGSTGDRTSNIINLALQSQ